MTEQRKSPNDMTPEEAQAELERIGSHPVTVTLRAWHWVALVKAFELLRPVVPLVANSNLTNDLNAILADVEAQAKAQVDDPEDQR